MLNKYLLLFISIGIMGMLSFGGSYTAPTFDSVNFSLCSGYIAPTFDSVNFTLGESDACVVDTCTYTSGNWDIDCSDNCSISSNVGLGGNNISIIGTGMFVTTANITNYGKIHIEGTDSSNICRVTCISGGCFE